ncbi:MAG: hypothetical protein QM817_24160 [Archangium sp.]
MRRVALTALLLTALSAEAVDFKGRVRLWAGPGVDTNAKREFVSSGVATQPDGFLFGLLQLDGQLTLAERVRIVGGYDVAARKFLRLDTEDTIVQSAFLESTVTFLDMFALGVSGRARDRRGADRDYTDLQGGAVIDFFPTANVDVRAQLMAHRFLFYKRFAYSFYGPDGMLTARYRFDRHHSISAFGSFNARTYNGHRFDAPGPEGIPGETDETRSDSVFGAGLSYTYRGPFHFTFAYSYFDQDSNSFGESVKRHRLSATAGFVLPWKLTLLGSLTWQPSIFPDGVYLNPDLTIVEDDENVSSLTIKLVRPLTQWFDLDLRYAGYLGIYPQNKFLYLRHVISLGLSFSF